jgi:hypothetical protein
MGKFAKFGAFVQGNVRFVYYQSNLQPLHTSAGVDTHSNLTPSLHPNLTPPKAV